MKTIEATYRIVTPMFIGGANSDPSDGIRPPSFKGALRFWWRALHWGAFLQDTQGDENAALKTLHKKECELFGSAANDKKGGQGCFLLSVSDNVFNQTKKDVVHSIFKTKDAARYLAYGLMEAFSSGKTGKQAGRLIRGCLNENQAFTISLKFRKNIDSEVLAALKALGLLGGLGSRARKGLGSIVLEKLVDTSDEKNLKKIWQAPNTIEAYKQDVSSLLKKATIGKASFTAFSPESNVAVLLSSNNAFDTLDKYGQAMLMYRSWGKSGKVLRKNSDKRFQDDHDWYRDTKKVAATFHPQRVVFGLPHNYGKPESSHVEPEKHKRRASPLMFHVHPIGNQFIGVGMIMKSSFLPVGEKIKAGERGVPANIDWDILADFFNGKVGENSDGNYRFPDKEMIFGGQT